MPADDNGVRWGSEGPDHGAMSLAAASRQVGPLMSLDQAVTRDMISFQCVMLSPCGSLLVCGYSYRMGIVSARQTCKAIVGSAEIKWHVQAAKYGDTPLHMALSHVHAQLRPA